MTQRHHPAAEDFTAAAEARSFARAAEQMHVSPAAISFQIKQIEHMSGFAMFERAAATSR